MQPTKDEKSLKQLESSICNFRNLTGNTLTVQNTLLRLLVVYLNSTSESQLHEPEENKAVAENMLYLLDLLDVISNYH